MAGTVFGIEQYVAPSLLLGVVAGYSNVNVTTNSRPDESEIEDYRIGLYGNYSAGSYYVLSLLSYGYDDYETSRGIVFGTINRKASADFHGHQLAAYVEGGLNMTWGDVDIQPLFGLQYIYLYQNDFSETGAGALNLAVDSTDTDSLRTVLGARIARPFCSSRGMLVTAEFRAQWMHELLGDDQIVQSNFVSIPGSSFTTRGVKLGRDFGLFGTGVTVQLNDRVSLVSNYDLQVSPSLTSHTGSGGLQFIW